MINHSQQSHAEPAADLVATLAATPVGTSAAKPAPVSVKKKSSASLITAVLLSAGLSLGMIGCAEMDSSIRNAEEVRSNQAGTDYSATDDRMMTSDHQLHDQIHAALNRNLPNLNQRIEVNVRSGDVYLSGTAATALQRDQAIATAQSVPQVQNVYYQNLAIANIPAQADYLSDVAIQARLHRAFNQQMPNEAVRVNVDVKNSRVFLTGVVANATDRARVHQLAHSIDGVKAVYFGDLQIANR